MKSGRAQEQIMTWIWFYSMCMPMEKGSSESSALGNDIADTNPSHPWMFVGTECVEIEI